MQIVFCDNGKLWHRQSSCIKLSSPAKNFLVKDTKKKQKREFLRQILLQSLLGCNKFIQLERDARHCDTALITSLAFQKLAKISLSEGISLRKIKIIVLYGLKF